ncbi:MAG: hypothetical protein M3O90_04605 [Actinomycetota bacterium]|nr:hypothetical protein [Actinomycetota bacterium]
MLDLLGPRLAGGEARRAPDQQLGFLAARSFANAQPISELRRTRRRLERILGALAEPVTVHHERGQLVYANAAAAALRLPARLATAPPGPAAPDDAGRCAEPAPTAT